MTIHTPNLPALIAGLPGPGTKSGAGYRAPQTEFTRERQVLFLENLSVTGSVRSASAAGGVSHQTAYRARRGQGEFRLAWDAAMVAARAHAAEVLAARAIDGVEEKVFYHGEHVDTRVRYSDRLLLAHLARLDRLVADPAVNAVAEEFDEALARFERGEAVRPEAPPPPPAPPAARRAGGGDFSPPGPCNTRSMSPPDTGPYADWRPVISVEDYTALALWAPMRREGLRFGAEWCAHVRAMLYARPDYAPPFEALLGSWDHNGNYGELRACIENQVNAYTTHDGKWWLLDQWNMVREDIEEEWLDSELAADMQEEAAAAQGRDAPGGAILIAQ